MIAAPETVTLTASDALPCDTTAPTLLSNLPASAATGVEVNEPIVINFSEGMDIATITSANITMVKTSNSAAIAGTFGHVNGQVKFRPNSNWEWNINYTVTITTNVKDAAGNALATATSFAFTTLTLAQQAYVKASNTGASDNFGTPVAISGNTIVVGASGERSAATGVNGNQADNTASASGAAYVFVRNGTTWSQQAYLKASNTGSGDHFTETAISGDTIAVGASDERSNATGINGNQADNSLISAGAVYVFK